MLEYMSRATWPILRALLRPSCPMLCAPATIRCYRAAHALRAGVLHGERVVLPMPRVLPLQRWRGEEGAAHGPREAEARPGVEVVLARGMRRALRCARACARACAPSRCPARCARGWRPHVACGTLGNK